MLHNSVNGQSGDLNSEHQGNRKGIFGCNRNCYEINPFANGATEQKPTPIWQALKAAQT
ncbi:MAG: hypothetical protein AB8A37_04975 [Prochlorococcus sp.]|jgi:hypothetical protein